MKIRLIVPHWGPLTLLDTCLEAATSALHDLPHSVHIHFAEQAEQGERWFAHGVNRGLRCVGTDDVAWVLNNDALAEQGCARAALDWLATHPRAGIVASQNTHPACRHRATWAGSGPYWPTGRHITGCAALGALAEPSREVWAPFASVFVRGAAVQAIGHLDESMAHICSDVDYCIRAAYAGWEVWRVPESRVTHEFSSSAAPVPDVAARMELDRGAFCARWPLLVLPEVACG